MHAAVQACERTEAVQLVSIALQLTLPSVSQLQNAVHVVSVMAIGGEPHVADGEAKHKRPKLVADALGVSPAIVAMAMIKLVDERMFARARVVLDALNDESVSRDE